MKAEKVILSFVAVFVGLVAAGFAFYLYQSTRVLPADKSQPLGTKSVNVTPTPADSDILSIDTPTDEQVFDKKVITITGKAVKDAVITISTEDSDQVVKPSDTGDFTLTQTIPDGTSIVQIAAIYPDGQEKKLLRTVTFSTESF